jgi:hypothetical protein
MFRVLSTLVLMWLAKYEYPPNLIAVYAAALSKDVAAPTSMIPSCPKCGARNEPQQ